MRPLVGCLSYWTLRAAAAADKQRERQQSGEETMRKLISCSAIAMLLLCTLLGVACYRQGYVRGYQKGTNETVITCTKTIKDVENSWKVAVHDVRDACISALKEIRP